jgi:glycosyltransferase involved in cell wall biosynthesis
MPPMPKILFVGHILKNKGVIELLEACILLEEKFELILIGPVENDMKLNLIQIASKKDDGQWLSFIGSKERKDVLKAMQEVSFLVLPSYTEGFPNVILEAMMCKKSVIATNVGAIPDMLNVDGDNPCGICVETKNIVQLKEAIKILLHDKELCVKYGETGYNRVQDIYSINKVFNQYLNLWDKYANPQKL